LRLNRASSLGSVSTPAASRPAAAQLAPRPACPRSNRSTVQPAAARRQPTPKPTTPPPMMAKRRPVAVEDASIEASVRWHYPAHVRWVCSQPAPRPAPQLTETKWQIPRQIQAPHGQLPVPCRIASSLESMKFEANQVQRKREALPRIWTNPRARRLIMAAT